MMLYRGLGFLLTGLFNIWRLRDAYFKFQKTTIFSTIFKYSFFLKQRKYGCYIDLNAKFANIPLFPHDLYGIFISGGTSIGNDCIIFQHVTIGSNTLKDSKGYGAPTIGNNVLIGAGATIIGRVNIGNNCRIGANCTVTDNIPENCVVVSPKSVVLKRNKIKNTFTKIEDGIEVEWFQGKWVKN